MGKSFQFPSPVPSSHSHGYGEDPRDEEMWGPVGSVVLPPCGGWGGCQAAPKQSGNPKARDRKDSSPPTPYWGWLCSATGWGAGRACLSTRGSPFSEAPPGEGGCEACSPKLCELRRELLRVILRGSCGTDQVSLSWKPLRSCAQEEGGQTLIAFLFLILIQTTTLLSPDTGR